MNASQAQRKHQELMNKGFQLEKLKKENPQRARVEAKKLARDFRTFENELSAIIDPLQRILMDITNIPAQLERF